MRDILNMLQEGTILNSLFDKFGLTGGVMIVMGCGILIFLVVAMIAERKTRVLFPDRKKRPGESDGFLNFDDEDEDDD